MSLSMNPLHIDLTSTIEDKPILSETLQFVKDLRGELLHDIIALQYILNRIAPADITADHVRAVVSMYTRLGSHLTTASETQARETLEDGDKWEVTYVKIFHLLKFMEHICNFLVSHMDLARNIAPRKMYFAGLLKGVLAGNLDGSALDLVRQLYRREQSYCDTCPICLEDGGGSDMVVLNCRHGVHASCVDSQYVLHNCPCCNVKMDEEYHTLFNVLGASTM